MSSVRETDVHGHVHELPLARAKCAAVNPTSPRLSFCLYSSLSFVSHSTLHFSLCPIYGSYTQFHHRSSTTSNVFPLFPLSGLFVWQAVRGYSITASALLLFPFWTWCIAVFTRPAWLINSPLQGLCINGLCLFYNEYAIFRDSHFHNTCIFPQHHLFCFVEEFRFVFHFFPSVRVQPANSFCSPLRFDWFRGCSWSNGENRGDKSKPLLIYYV